MPRRNRPSKITKRLPLKKGQVMVIQADDPNHERGLLIELVGKGGYDIAYWYDKPELVYPAEIRVDGRTVAKDGRIVHIGYHPELAQPSSFKKRKKSRSNPEDWIEQVTSKSKSGVFTAQAKRAGYPTALAYAKAIMKRWRAGFETVKNKKTGRMQRVTIKTMRRANLALNLQKRRP